MITILRPMARMGVASAFGASGVGTVLPPTSGDWLSG